MSSVWLLHALRLKNAIATKQRQLRRVFGFVMECAFRRGFAVFFNLGRYSFPLSFVGVQNVCRSDDTGLMAEKCELVGNVFCDKFLRDFAKWPTLCWTATRMHQDWMCSEVPLCTFAGMKFGRRSTETGLMRKFFGCLALCLGMLAGSAHADATRLYFGAGFSDGSVDISGGGDKSLGTVHASFGMQLLDYLGIELALGAGSDDSDSVLGDPLAQYQAALLRIGHRWDRAGVYLLAGQARLDIDSSLNNSNSGNALGFGLNFFGSETTALNFHVLDFDGGAFTTATIGFQYFIGGFR